MKFLAIALSLSAFANVSMAQPPRPQPPPNQGTSFVTVYRFNNPTMADHFYSTDETEGTRAGLVPESGGDFQLAYTQVPGFDKPIYRCAMSGGNHEHFLSNDSRCEGQSRDGRNNLLGYAASSPRSTNLRVVPLQRYAMGSAHVECLPGEYPVGYQPEGILGYVLR